MNRQFCEKNLDAYLEGRLPDDIRTQVDEHLNICTHCADIYRLQSITESVVNREKAVNPDIYLTTRIMARIGNSETSGTREVSLLSHFLKPAIIATSLAAAIFSGVIIGNIYRPANSMKTIPVELALINDATIESLDLLSIE